MQQRNWIPILAIAIYGTSIVLGRKFMVDRKAVETKIPIALWNFSLSLFSFIGAFRTIPHLFYAMSVMSLRDIMCTPPAHTFGIGSTGLWVQLFCLSKFPELFDTFFVVIHKKPLLFLHWYHHISVLLYCWHACVNERANGLFFICMNYSVHAVMYGYYFLSAIKMKPNWLKASFITKFQISQMFIGVVVTLLGFKFQSTDNCHVKTELNIAAFLMYGSYLLLFCLFYAKKYSSQKKVKKLE
uniref:Elongation of fatty acids protein n=1 Tax=Proboscia inermis TaxID=420281 RepID=A0A7S0CFD6_9STRA|mmetsp:Transcript_4331/g.4461  ORF Transcript_4331/g.4461 Transcript_4331/m.4461 type:complete len:242 (+) Transcript_4331:130-855(+)